MLDGHIHILEGSQDRKKFLDNLYRAGMQGGLLISRPPASLATIAPAAPATERLENLVYWCEAGPDLYPFYWIDPLEEDALAQVEMASQAGVMGFKVICDRYYAGDPRVLPIFQAIAEIDRPILFHSGILWDGKPSSQYNRPLAFESLLKVQGLRFALAHIAWPWCDELIALYGKFLNAHVGNPELAVEMFIDLTPGTPPIYRRQALVNLFTVGYDVQYNVIFGSDCNANDYNTAWTQQWIERDRAIFKELNLSEDVIANIYTENLKRFVGISTRRIERELPKPGE